GNGFDLHIFGMWINFLLSAGLITFFVSRMSGALREQDHQLAEQQERLLQREQVVALGALAAGAAHELGTPLSTMTVIARDIETDLPADSPLREDVAVLRRQLALCRDILNELRAQAGGEPRRMTLARFVSATVERMEVVHPARQFRLPATFPMQKLAMPAQGLVPPEQKPVVSEQSSAEQELAIAPALQQVLVNLLDNAAQAARNTVEIDVTDEGDFCCINIRDDGPGIAPDIAARLGQPFVSDKPDGLGLGYFLSHASLNPLGGRIEMQTLRQGGTLTRLCLPWRVLLPAGSAV
ncbi:MAG: ATP-binding protein, partial [Moraxellaceae bacterium]|nr:ATP-binding protein [Moraxellaceae bacterium]